MRRGLVSLVFLLIAFSQAKADLLFTYSGTVDTVTYNNVSMSTPQPFYQGEPVFAQFQLIGNQLPTQPLSETTGAFVQFGPVAGENTIYSGRLPMGFLTVNSAGEVVFTDFCCNFPSITDNGVTYTLLSGENGQAFLYNSTFTARYLVYSLTASNVAASGSGTWTMQEVPEPSSLAVFATALAALAIGLFARRRRCEMAAQGRRQLGA